MKAHKNFVVLNSSDRDCASDRYILAIGVYYPTYIMVWADSFDDAFELTVNWIAENQPGLLANDEIEAACDEARALHSDDEDALDLACNEITDAYAYADPGLYIDAQQIGFVLVNPSRARVKAFIASLE